MPNHASWRYRRPLFGCIRILVALALTATSGWLVIDPAHAGKKTYLDCEADYYSARAACHDKKVGCLGRTIKCYDDCGDAYKQCMRNSLGIFFCVPPYEKCNAVCNSNSQSCTNFTNECLQKAETTKLTCIGVGDASAPKPLP
jgi:hypothetical protein